MFLPFVFYSDNSIPSGGTGQPEGDTGTSQPDDPSPGEEKDKNKEEPKFTQEQVENIVKDRLARTLKKFEGYDEMKKELSSFRKKAKEQEEANMTELEKIQNQLENEQKEKQEISEKLSGLQSEIKQTKINYEFQKKAQEKGIQGKQLEAALKLADFSNVELEEDGNVKGIEDVVGVLVEEYDFLIQKKEKPRPIGTSSNPSGGSRKDKTAEELVKEAYEKAKKSGHPDDLLAYRKLKRELEV